MNVVKLKQVKETPQDRNYKELYQETIDRAALLKPMQKIDKTRKTKKQLDKEFKDQIRQQEAEAFMRQQLTEEITGNKRDKDGQMFGINQTQQINQIGQGAQGRQQDLETMTKDIYNEDVEMKKKKKDRVAVQTIMENYDYGTIQNTPAVKWAESVYNKQSREGYRKNNSDLQSMLAFSTQKKPEIKSTTEINIILQQRLGHASVDELISRRELTPAQIAKQQLMLVRPRSNGMNTQFETRRQNTVGKTKKQPEILPSKRIIKKKEDQKKATPLSPKKTGGTTQIKINPSNKVTPSSTIQSASQTNIQSGNSSLPMTMHATMNKSALKKRPNHSQHDVHEGLHLLERTLKLQSRGQHQSTTPERFSTMLNKLEKAKNVIAQSNGSKQSWNQSISGTGILNKQERDQFDNIYADRVPKDLSQINTERRNQHLKSIQISVGEQKLRQSPMMSKITSGRMSRNRSHSKISSGTESLVNTLTNGDQYNTQMSNSLLRLDSSTEKEQSTISIINESKSKLFKNNSPQLAQNSLNFPNKRLKIVPKKTEDQTKLTQAQLFAELTGCEPVTNEQDKDERHGRVVRDYQMLQENKRRMQSLISLLAAESEENGNAQRSLKLENMKQHFEKTEPYVASNLLTPRSEIRSDENQSKEGINRSASILPKITNNSITRASSTILSADPMKSKMFSYKKQKPFDYQDCLSGDDGVKLIPDNKTSLTQKNFKYFLVKPHIYLANGQLVKRNQRIPPSQLDSNLDSMSMMVIKDNPHGFSTGDNQQDKGRPTSFNGRTLPRNLFAQDTLSRKKTIPTNSLNFDIDGDYRNQTDQIYGGISSHNDGGGVGSYNDGNRNFNTNASQQYLHAPDGSSMHMLSLSQNEIDDLHKHNKSENVFALSQNIRNFGYPMSEHASMLYEPSQIDIDGKLYAKLGPITPGNGSRRNLKVVDVKSRIDTNHKQTAKLTYGQTNYYNPLTYVLVKGRVKPTFDYAVKLPYAEPLIQHVQKQQHAMKIDEHQSSRKYKQGSDFKVGSPYKSTPVKDVQLLTSINKQIPTQSGRNISSNQSKRNKNKNKQTRTSLETPKGGSHPQIQIEEKSQKKKISKKQKQSRKAQNQKDAAIDRIRVTQGNDDDPIMEMSEEGSDISEILSEQLPKDPNKDQAWEDIYLENEQLKVQIASQITIFEQYLRVAMLQQRQREIEMKRAERIMHKGIFDGVEVIIDKTRPGEEVDEQTQIINDEEARKERLKQRAKLAEKKFIGGYQKTRIEERPLSTRSNDSNNSQQSKNRYNIKGGASLKKGRSMSASSRNSQGKSQKQLNKNPSVMMLKQIHATDQAKSRRNKTEQKQGLAHRFMRYISTPASKVIIMPKLGIYGYNLQDDSHNTHQMWLSQIEALWRRLEYHRENEVVKVETMIEQNRARIFDLTRDNVFELEVQTNDQKMLLRAKFNAAKMQQALKQTKEERMLRKIQKKLRRALSKNEEISSWGLQNYVVSLQIKCRAQEDIIDLAQRLLLKPDALLEQRLERLKRLRDQTFQDLYYFITEREKVHWRNWDHQYMGDWKPEIPPKKNLLAYYTDKGETTLMQIEFIELQSLQLQSDINGFNKINAESIETVTEKFGHDHWLHFWQLQQLRKKQEKRSYDQDPSKEHLSALKDPVKLEFYHQKREDLGKAEIEEVDLEKLKTFKLPETNKNAGKAVTFEGDQSLAFEVAHDVHIQDMNVDIDDYLLGDTERRNIGDQLADKELNDQADKALEEAQRVLVGAGRPDVDDPANQEETKDGKKPFVSKWLQAISKSKKEEENRQRKERETRVARLQKLFDDDNDHGIADALDKHAAEKKMADYLNKIDTHLRVELQLLDAWQDRPRQELQPEVQTSQNQ